MHKQQRPRSFGLSWVLMTVVVVVVVVCVPAWPGVFTVDSQAIFRDSITGRISNWYSPGITSIWSIAEKVGIGPGTIFVGGVTLVAIGLWVTYRLWFPAGWASALTIGTALFPPVYGMLGWVGRDVWFLGLLMCTIGALGWAIREPRKRLLFLTVGLVTALVAVDARQNALPIVMLWAMVSAALMVPTGKRKPLFVVLAVLGGLILALGFRSTVNTIVVDRQMHPFQPVMMRDLVGISVIADTLYLPESLNPGQDLAELERLWSESSPHDRGSRLLMPDSPVIVDPYENGEAVNALVARAWRNTVLEEPLAYLESRSELYLAQMSILTPSQAIFFGVSDEMDWVRSYSLRQTFPELNEVRMNYLFATSVDGQSNVGGPLYRTWVYLILGIAGSVAIGLSKSELRIFGWSLLMFQLLMQALLFVAVFVAQYRFMYFQVLLGIVLTIGGISEQRSSRRLFRAQTSGTINDSTS